MENWKPVPGYEGYYEVSDLGRARSLDRTTPDSRGWTRTIPGRILRPARGSNPQKYYRVMFSHPSHGVKGFELHRLVCRVFHGEPPSPKMVAMHLDGDNTNNRANNLRWGTYTENHFQKRVHGTASSFEFPADYKYHGDQTGYGQGCRCWPCTIAHQAYMKDWRSRNA